MTGLYGGERISAIGLTILSQYQRVVDGRTERRIAELLRHYRASNKLMNEYGRATNIESLTDYCYLMHVILFNVNVVFTFLQLSCCVVVM